MNNKQQVIGALKVLQDSYGIAANSKQNIAVGRAIAIVEVVMSNTTTSPTTPAIDWKPINVTHMEVDKLYLFWCESAGAPETGCVTRHGDFINTWGDRFEFEDVPTHYAEFNKPEGTE